MSEDELTIEERAELEQLKAFLRDEGERAAATLKLVDGKPPAQLRVGLTIFRNMRAAMRSTYEVLEDLESGVITGADASKRWQRIDEEMREFNEDAIKRYYEALALTREPKKPH